MADRAITLAYFRYFSDHPQSYLIGIKKAKVAKNNLIINFIKIIFAKTIFISNIFGRFCFYKRYFC